MSKSKSENDTAKSTKDTKKQFFFEIHLRGQTIKIN